MSVDLHTVFQGKRVAVLGASGFIGRWVSRKVQQSGAELVCFVRDVDRSAAVLARYGVNASIQRGDAREADALSRSLGAVAPHVVVNLMAYGVNPAHKDEAEAYAVNADFPGHLAEMLAGSGPSWEGNRLVHVGTQYEYGRVDQFHEDQVAEPTTLYGESKLAGTEAVIDVSTQSGLRATTARVFNVFGPGEGEHRLLPSLARAGREGVPIDLTSGEQERDFCYVEDIAEGLLRLAAADGLGGDPINLASGRLTRVAELIGEAAHQLQIDRHLLRFGARPDRAAEVLKPRVFVDRLRHLTGWLPDTSIEEGIRRTVAFAPHTE